MTYGEVHQSVCRVGSALKAVGIANGDAVGIYAVNSPQWMVGMKSADFCGALTIPLYDTFGADAVEYIIKHSAVKVVFVSADQLTTIKKILPSVKDQVVQVVVWSNVPGTDVDAGSIQVWSTCRKTF